MTDLTDAEYVQHIAAAELASIPNMCALPHGVLEQT